MEYLLLIIASILIIVNHLYDVNDNKNRKKRIFSLIIMILALIFFWGNSVYQKHDSNRKEAKIDRLINNAQEDSIFNNLLNKQLSENAFKIDKLDKANDSLVFLISYLQSQLNLTKIQLEKGFEQNQESISNIKGSNIKRNRFLTSLQKSKMISTLSSLKGSKITIRYNALDSECAQFVDQFKQVFEKSGWKVKIEPNISAFSSQFQEINLLFKYYKNNKLQLDCIFESLKTAELDYLPLKDDSLPKDLIIMFIGDE